jgi:2-polyprenyl-3-methyl-5-hydroxy-6-metoxy-1,4-benzoquinol methylase/uncharacterized protein YbaR (Trm112 family)
MQEELIEILRCPVTRSRFTVQIISKAEKIFGDKTVEVIDESILFSEEDWFYPVIKGVPRLNVEAFIDYEDFLKNNIDDYQQRKQFLLKKYSELIEYVLKKNKRTKESFSKEWSIYDHEKDKTWDADNDAMLKRFLAETDETIDSIKPKIIFDAGCGNGKLNSLIASFGITIIGMDFSNSIEEAYKRNIYPTAHFIQGDVQFPPLIFKYFDIVHSSGVLIHTNNTELSFSCIEPTVKAGGKLSVWLYHHRKGFIHNLFNSIRSVTSKLPLGFQYYLYCITIFPVSYLIKKLKGNKQNPREMMVDILDWFTPQFRWEHGHTEAATWFYKRGFKNVKVTTNEIFGFNITGEK